MGIPDGSFVNFFCGKVPVRFREGAVSEDAEFAKMSADG
tara:strand:- start:2737 stop:2853 length:117 start_codon:yes stop_codon:yes gene_type:complete